MAEITSGCPGLPRPTAGTSAGSGSNLIARKMYRRIHAATTGCCVRLIAASLKCAASTHQEETNGPDRHCARTQCRQVHCRYVGTYKGYVALRSVPTTTSFLLPPTLLPHSSHTDNTLHASSAGGGLRISRRRSGIARPSRTKAPRSVTPSVPRLARHGAANFQHLSRRNSPVFRPAPHHFLSPFRPPFRTDKRVLFRTLRCP